MGKSNLLLFRFRYNYTDKWVSFLRSLFERMNMSFTSHEVKLVLYGRLYYPQFRNPKELYAHIKYQNPNLASEIKEEYYKWFHVNQDGDVFQDIYIKIGFIEPSKNNWDNIIMKLKRMFNYFPSLISWTYDNAKIRKLTKYFTYEDYHNSSVKLLNKKSEEEQFMSGNYMLDWELSGSWNSSILEAINLSIGTAHIDQSKW